MSSSISIADAALIAEIAIIVALAVYGGYRALTIRHALYSRAYRNQALAAAVAFLALAFLAFTNLAPGSYASGNPTGLFYYIGPIFVAAIYSAFFYMVDVTARAGRFSDPLLRDTLHWSQARKVLWALNILCIVLTFVTGIFLLLFTFFLPIVSGALLFPVLARRTGDMTLRRHMRWLGGFFVLFFLSVFFYPNVATDAELVIDGLPLVMGALFLTISARSLAPLNRISAIEKSLTAPTTAVGSVPK